MYHLMSEIKKQQSIIKDKVNRLLDLHEAHYYGSSEEEQELMLELKREFIFQNRELKRLLETFEFTHCWSDEEQPCCCCDCDDSDTPAPEPPQVLAHGFAYTNEVISKSGTVPLRIAGPLQNVELTSEGFVISNAGVYQLQYTVSVNATDEVNLPARFQLFINDVIRVGSSAMETNVSKQLMSTQLFSLLEGDVVKLVAEIPEGMSYSMATLQLVQVG